jgi:hypothetical protein
MGSIRRLYSSSNRSRGSKTGVAIMETNSIDPVEFSSPHRKLRKRAYLRLVMKLENERRTNAITDAGNPESVFYDAAIERAIRALKEAIKS